MPWGSWGKGGNISINQKQEGGEVSGSKLGGEWVDEGLVDFGVRVEVKEAKEAETEDTSDWEVASLKGRLDTEEERVEPLQVLVHLLFPVDLF